MTETLLDQIEARLRAGLEYNENAEVAPVVLLWPDRERQFRTAAERLRERLPVITLGEFAQDKAAGPAYWLRCVVAGTITLDLPEGVPIVYVPGVAREDLRAIENCPRQLAPIAELQYRGEWFAHPNGKDWTVRSLLSNPERGLGLDIAHDAATGSALLGAFSELLDLPIRRLADQFIDADFLERQLNPDLVGALVEWLDDPAGHRARLSAEQWRAFVGQAQREYGFDPETQGEVIGGRLLGERDGAWQQVWERFADDPERYQGVEQRLRTGRPDEFFVATPASWPQDNEEQESRLRSVLAALADVPPGQARAALEQLWDEHRERRGWVWAKLGHAPMAFALEQLHRLAQKTRGNPATGVDELAKHYAAEGWEADDAFLAALAAVSTAQDREAVVAAGCALYRPWLEAHARALQEAVGPLAHAGTYRPGGEVSTTGGTVNVFVDGLRLDLAHRLAARLGDLDVEIDTSLAALPTVTDTAKPVLVPVPDESLSTGSDLGPARASSGTKAGIAVLRSLMGERGVEVLQGADTGDPAGCAWTETGDLDGRGHQFGSALVDEIDGELDRIATRVKLLLDAGWAQVDVVTDHGWLLLPGGLAKAELSVSTTEVKKGRCARLKEGADVSYPTVPWHWDSSVRVALAPGIACFEAGKEYEHGGVSLQECVVPRMRVRAGAVPTVTGGAAITKVKWLGLLCRVEFEHVPAGATLDIRGMPKDPSTSVAEDAKDTTGAGKARLYVADEELEGERAFLVIVAPDGSIVAQREVTIGSNR